ncbi:hypothetical protein HGRIS_010455 [Hohenbuehelia grisea]|uniref:Uncharacterized protein n=1 Tax=Hohenbuehelia grisea TaxID=104357 RepID=A0ABR3IZA8_9AGAR
MPAKYSHVKKRSASGLLKKAGQSPSTSPSPKKSRSPAAIPVPSPHADRGISQAMTAVSQLERAIAKILLLRFEQDIARLYSTRLYSIALIHLPTLIMRCVALSGPSWPAFNADCEELKDLFRTAISMDMRQAGERVATKSVLWSYTALRHFAMSNGVSICRKKGLHSLRLLPYFPALKAHLDVLESMPPPTFSKPPHLGALTEGQEALEDACELKYAHLHATPSGKYQHTCTCAVQPEWDTPDWREKLRVGYEKTTQTLWRVAREFDVRGYGLMLRDKLTTKWCDCGCSTDHLGEVCERTVREDLELNRGDGGAKAEGKGKGKGKGEAVTAERVKGKEKEWDGRGSGVYGWETQEEEDIWENEMDFYGWDGVEDGHAKDASKHGHNVTGAIPEDELGMTIGEVMEWRYIRAERAKEEGNVAFRKGNFEAAVVHYKAAHTIEPELPHYQLNLAMAHLKLNNWIEAEQACTTALGQHRSGKGYYRRAKARKMLGRHEEAIKDLRMVLKLQPTNAEAISELLSLLPPLDEPKSNTHQHGSSSRLEPSGSSSSSSTRHQPSGSSSSYAIPATSSGSQSAPSHDPLHRIFKPKPSKPLPFTKTRSDERKLKFTFIPMTIDGPPRERSHATYCEKHAKQCGHDHFKARTGPKAKENRKRAWEGLNGSISYPGWDRYTVKKAD